jgi:hypothetical protein
MSSCLMTKQSETALPVQLVQKTIEQTSMASEMSDSLSLNWKDQNRIEI